MNSHCPLCLADVEPPTLRVSSGSYHHCTQCDLVFLAPTQRLDRAAEHAFYLTHENDIHDPRYRKFLAQLSVPMMQRLKPGAQGLDFGAGPGPALAAMFNESGFPTAIHDPAFAPETAVLEDEYDFITCTEVVEHLHEPRTELTLLNRILKHGGRLGIMTELRPSIEAFDDWYYHRDPTHVCFYSKATMQWIGKFFGWEPELLEKRVILFYKP